MTQKQPKKGKAAFHLFELDTVATKTIADLTRNAVALRERAAAAATEAERDTLRFEAEEVYFEAQRVIKRTYGSSRKADEVDDLVNAAMSAITMPTDATAIDYGCDTWD